jgi:hypothetical protein
MDKKTEAQRLAAELDSKSLRDEYGERFTDSEVISALLCRQEALLWKALDVLGRTDSEPGSRAWERESELIAIIREHLSDGWVIPEKPSFDLDAACKEALDRVRESIEAEAHTHRVLVKLDFAATHRCMCRRWIEDEAHAGLRRAAREWAESIHTFGKVALNSKLGKIGSPPNYILQALDDLEPS